MIVSIAKVKTVLYADICTLENYCRKGRTCDCY